MKYIQIPDTELKPSALVMGSICNIEGEVDGAYRILDMYRDAGGNMLDSANVYGKFFPTGTNICDAHIGKWMKSRGCRNDFIVETKGGHPDVKDFSVSRLKKRDIQEDIEESLGALQTDTVDLFFLHRDDTELPVEEIIDYLNDFKMQGKIRYFGCSNWSVERITEARKYAADNKIEGFCANQTLWSMADADMNSYPWPGCVNMSEKMYDMHKKTGMAAFAYESQARGFFQKYQKRAEKEVPENLLRIYGAAENINRFQRAQELAVKNNLSLSAVVLAYILSSPFPAYALIGPRTEEQFWDSMEAAEVRLMPEELDYLKG